MPKVLDLKLLCPRCGEQLRARRELGQGEEPPARVRVVCPCCEQLMDALLEPVDG